jgi:hypothetical protein
MGKGKGKRKQLDSKADSESTIIGLLADDTVIRTINVPDTKSITLGEIISTIGANLQGHVNKVFGLGK